MIILGEQTTLAPEEAAYVRGLFLFAEDSVATSIRLTLTEASLRWARELVPEAQSSADFGTSAEDADDVEARGIEEATLILTATVRWWKGGEKPAEPITASFSTEQLRRIRGEATLRVHEDGNEASSLDVAMGEQEAWAQANLTSLPNVTLTEKDMDQLKANSFEDLLGSVATGHAIIAGITAYFRQIGDAGNTTK